MSRQGLLSSQLRALGKVRINVEREKEVSSTCGFYLLI